MYFREIVSSRAMTLESSPETSHAVRATRAAAVASGYAVRVRPWPSRGPSMILALLLASTLLTPVSVAGAETAKDAPVAAATPTTPPGRLATVLQPLMEDRLFKDAVIGLQIVNARTGEEAFAYQADRPMQPASVMKLLTTAAALRNLGPAWRFSTDFLTDKDATITPEGVLQGNLYVRGGGDPTLVVEKLWRMVADLQTEGVNSIEGNIVFDDSFFQDSPLIPGWDKDVDIQNGPSYFAPLSALSVNYNTACLVIGPGPAAGQPARVSLDTPVAVIQIDNKVTTVRAGARRWLRIDRELDEKDPTIVKFTLRGEVPLDDEIDREYRTVADPLAHFISVFRGVLDDRKLKVKGRFVQGVTPKDAARLVHMDSAPLSNVLADMNKHSSNFMAEQVLRAVGATVRGAPGTTAKGVSVIQDYLVSIGIAPDTFKLVNGSGLSRDVSVPPSVITAVILDMYGDHKVSYEFMSSLAIGGVDGTLWARFRDEDAVGRLRGKTGSLNGVFCLAGIVDGGDGEVYAFAMLANDLGSSSWPIKRLYERFGDAIIAMSATDAGAGEGAAADDGAADAQ